MTNRVATSGHSGEDVKAVQHALNTWKANPPLKPDGHFGDKTEAAVREFQKRAKLHDHGRVGYDTRRALFPVGVVNCTVLLTRNPAPAMTAGQPISPLSMRFPTDPHQALSGQVQRAIHAAPMKPMRLPGCPYHLFAPAVPDFTFDLPPPVGSAPGGTGFTFSEVDLQPGMQTTISPGTRRQDLVVVTMQSVFLRGPGDGPNQQIAIGVSAGAPVSRPFGPMTLTPYFQITDVDRFWHKKMFHFWQPFAQVGLQMGGGGTPQLQLGVTPFNFSADVGSVITFNASAGGTASLDLVSGKVSVGAQFMGGVTIKLGQPNTPFW